MYYLDFLVLDGTTLPVGLSVTLLLLLVLYRIWTRIGKRLEDIDASSCYVLVTGCDSGFGRLLTLRLDKLGFNVFAACLTGPGARELDEMTSNHVMTFVMDITKDGDIENARKYVVKRLPAESGLWAIVNNAGIMGDLGPSEMMTRRQFRAPIEVNLLGTAQILRHFLPLVRKGSGRVVNTASAVCRFALGPAPYVTSKWAVMGFTEVLREELHDQGITVHCMLPGGYRTPMTDWDNLQHSLIATYTAASPEIQCLYGGLDYLAQCKSDYDLASKYMLGSNLQEVVDAYMHALTSSRPSKYYIIGYHANLLFRVLWMMPTPLADWFIAFSTHRISMARARKTQLYS